MELLKYLAVGVCYLCYSGIVILPGSKDNLLSGTSLSENRKGRWHNKYRTMNVLTTYVVSSAQRSWFFSVLFKNCVNRDILIYCSDLHEWSQTVCFCNRKNIPCTELYLMVWEETPHENVFWIPLTLAVLQWLWHCTLWCFYKNEFSTIILCYSHFHDLFKLIYEIAGLPVLFYSIFTKQEVKNHC